MSQKITLGYVEATGHAELCSVKFAPLKVYQEIVA
jgi:hypothetical protein